MIRKIICCVIITVMVITTTSLRAEAKEFKRINTGNDPADFISRNELSFKHQHGTRHLNFLTLRTDIAISSNISLRLDLPVEGRVSDDTGDDLWKGLIDPDYRLGDILIEPSYRFYSSDNVSAIAGLRVIFDTASRDEIGNGATIYAPVLAAGWRPAEEWLFASVIKWTVGNGLHRDITADSLDRDEISFRQIIAWEPHKKYIAWLLIDPEIIYDFERDEEEIRLGGEYGVRITDSGYLFVRYEGNIGGQQRELSAAISGGFRWIYADFILQ